LDKSGSRIYLHLVTSESKSFTVADPNKNTFTIYLDEENNLYTKNGALKNYLTGYPFDEVGEITIAKDMLGVTYNSVNDAYGNTFVTYVDAKGKYFYDSNRNQVYVKNSGNLRAN
jgi:hypothetical protein